MKMPYEYASSVSLGEATIVVKTNGVTINKNGEIYFATNGAPAVFHAVNALTGEILFTERLPDEDVVWAITIGSDKNVYFGGTLTGRLYRYMPSTKKLETVGIIPINTMIWDLDASDDGNIYGSTSDRDNKGHAFVYNISTNQFTNLGPAFDGQEYVRGGGVSGDYFYAGTGAVAHLLKYNRHTLEKEEISTVITGVETMISNVWAYDGKLFVVYGTSLLVMNEVTLELLQHITWQSETVAFDGILSTPSPYNRNLIYFRNKNSSRLWTYNLANNKFEIVSLEQQLPNASSKAMEWVTLQNGPLRGRRVLLIVSNELHVSQYDPIEQTLASYTPNVAKVGIEIQSLEAGPDGKLYMGGYQAAMSIYDTALGKFTVQEKDPHQIEGIGFINGKAYFGIYGGAKIYEYDPMESYQLNLNPKMIYDIGNDQSRPFTFATGEHQLFIGTIADYGKLGGALTIYDTKRNTWSEYPNIVEHQSIIGLAYQHGKVYGGTTVWGGLGIEPSESKAKLFEWDVAAAKATYLDTPAIDGFSPVMVGELSIGPDDNLWGIMSGSTADYNQAAAIFVMNPLTKEIVKSRIITTGSRASTWRPFFIRWGEDGLLYTTLGRKLCAINPDTLEIKQLYSHDVHLMTLGDDGSIYFAQGAKLLRMAPRMKAAELSGAAILSIGSEINLNIKLHFANGKSGHSDGTEITYSVDFPAIAQVIDSKLIGLSSGSVQVKATVKQDAVTVTTNTISVQVTDR